MYEDVLERVIKVIKGIVPEDIEEINSDSNIMEDLALSSVDMFYLLSEIEIEFDFEVSDNVLRKIVTVEDMARIICDILEEQK